MSKDKEVVSLTGSGKVKIRLNSVKRACFTYCLAEMVKNCDAAVKEKKELDVMSYTEYAELALLMDLYQRYFNNHDYEQTAILNLSRHEALLLWGSYENYCYSLGPLTRAVMLAIHQKLC